MADSICQDYPPDLNEAQSENLLCNLNDWAIAHGLAVRPPLGFVSAEVDPHRVLATTAPVTLFPSPFPRDCYDEACAIQVAYNKLYAAVANDEAFLEEVVQEIVDVDDFIAQLWKTHVEVKRDGYVQSLSLGLFRSDYMIHVDPEDPKTQPEIKQVEFNTIASSFAGLSGQVSRLHQHLFRIGAYPPSPLLKQDAFPCNDSISGLAEGLAAACRAYGLPKSAPRCPLCVLIVVQSAERNVFDQRHLEYELWTKHNTPIFRLPFAEILARTSVSSTSLKSLLYTPKHNPATSYEVSVVYFRAGYTPTDYPTPDAWSARLQIERSGAIKCPSVLTQLAGCKKVQQVLATPSSPHLARFLADTETASRIRSTFTNIYPLDADTPGGEFARTHALDPVLSQNFVLKPQREGGGNNIYRGAIPPFLRSLPRDHWKSYILMELIEPPT
ncbi:MAG: hypothetical protein M1838_004028, partial [Thelocarpon superellum]